MKIISIREIPEMKDRAVEYISSEWDAPKVVYEDCITHSLTTPNPLPQWYLLESDGKIIGCAGRRTFICNALSWGIAPQVVMKWIGHSDYKAMKPYIDIADDIKASAMDKFNRL